MQVFILSDIKIKPNKKKNHALRYFIRAVINRSALFQSNIKLDKDFMVQNISHISLCKPVSMQVGVNDCLHIKFNYNKIWRHSV